MEKELDSFTEPDTNDSDPNTNHNPISFIGKLAILTTLALTTGCASSGTRVRHSNYHPSPTYHSHSQKYHQTPQYHSRPQPRYHPQQRAPIGLPRHMTPQNIERKFKYDVETLRRQQQRPQPRPPQRRR